MATTDIHIDPETAAVAIELLAGVVTGLGGAPVVEAAAIAVPAVKLAVRLSDAGYKAPSVEQLMALQSKVEALEDLAGK